MHRLSILKRAIALFRGGAVVAVVIALCHAAPGQEVTPPVNNLVAGDGSFDTAGGWPLDLETMKIVKEGGQTFLRMTNGSHERATALTRNVALPLRSGFVRVSVRMRTKGLDLGKESGEEARVALRFLNAEGEALGDSPAIPNLRADSGWVARQVEVDVPDGATELQVQPGLWRATGTLDIDDLRIEAYPTRAVYLRRVVKPMEGAGLTILPLINTVPDLDLATDRVYAVKPEWVSLGIDLRAQFTGFVPGRAGARSAQSIAAFFDGQGERLGGEVVLLSITGKGSGWQPVKTRLDIPEGARFVRLRFELDNAAGMLEIDGLRLTPERAAPLADAVLAPTVTLGWGEEAVTALSGKRGSISLNGIWRFMPAIGPAEREPTIGWGYVQVPSDWRRDAAFVMRGTGRQWATFRGDSLSRAWYERTIKLPPAWQGRAVLVDLRRVSTDAVVYVNDSEAGRVVSPSGTADITPFVEPGKEARLRIGVTTAEGNQLRGLIGNVTLLSRPKGAHVGDVFVRPSTRKNSVFVDVAVANVGKEGPVTFTARMLDEHGKVEKTFSARETLKKAATQTVTLAFPWPDARRWDVAQPNLYTLQLGAVGAGLDDEYPQTFGFREFWSDGRKFFLNGTEIRLRPTRIAADGPNGGTTGARKVLSDGFNFGEVGPDVLGPGGTITDADALYEDADRAGLPCAAYVLPLPPFLRDWDDPSTRTEYQQQTTAELWRIRNHPSVLLYSTSLRAVGDTAKDSRSPDANRKANEAIAMIKTFDPTRPVSTSDGSDGGDVDTLHVNANPVPLQEQEEWPSEWTKSGQFPLRAIALGSPLPPNVLRGWDGASFVRDTEPLLTEWSAAYLGPRAYAVGPASAREVEALFLRNIWRAWRTWGVSGGILPAGDGRDRPEVARNGGPTLAWIAGPQEAFTAKDHSFTAGQLVAKTLVLINDRRTDQNYSAAWKATVGDVAVGGGAFRGVMKSAATLMLPIEFGTPAVSTKSEGTITVTASIGSDKHEDVFPFRVFPGEPAAVLPEVAVFDPAGETTEMLKALGYTVRSLKEGDALPEDGVLVVGRRALSDRHLLPENLSAFVRGGGRLLVMGQDPRWIESALGLRVAPCLARRVYRVKPNDPVFAGLDDTDLRDWSGSSRLISAFTDDPIRRPDRHYGGRGGNRGALTSAPIEKPHRAAWRPLLETEFDLAYTPLMEMEYSKGRITLCTLDLEDYVAADPAARWLAEKALEHVTSAPIPPKSERTLYLGDEAGARLLDALGAKYQRATGVPADGEGLLILSANAKADDAALTAFLERGGRALVLAGRIGTGPLEATYGTAATFGGSLNVPDWPETAGLSPSDLRWRANHEAYLIMPGDGREIGADNLLARKSVGKGVILYCQIDPTFLPADGRSDFRFTRWRQTRALCQILSNLGASFAQGDQMVSLLTRPEKGGSPSPDFYNTDRAPGDDPYGSLPRTPILAKDSGGQEREKPLP